MRLKAVVVPYWWPGGKETQRDGSLGGFEMTRKRVYQGSTFTEVVDGRSSEHLSLQAEGFTYKTLLLTHGTLPLFVEC